MRILYISQYFHPEIGAPTNRAAAIIKAMKGHGHKVTVLCEMPNHPQGVIFPGYKGKLIAREEFSGIPVIHLPVINSPRKNFLTRIAMYLSFSISTMIYIACKRPRFDLLYISSPPLFVSLCGLLSKMVFHKRKLVFEVRDLWPDSAVEFGELKNKLLIKLSASLEKRIYEKSDLVVAATGYIGRVIASKGIGENKIFVSRNGVDDIILNSFSNTPSKTARKVFIAIFAGNMGLAYDLKTVIHCAETLQEEPVRFLFIGDGPCARELRNLSHELSLKNVSFRDMIPMSELGKVFAEADFGIVSLKDLPVTNGSLPVKIFDYMAHKLPIVSGLKGEAAGVITEAGAGIVVPPGDAAAMAQAFKKLMREPDTVKKMGDDAREYVLKNFRRTNLANLLVTELNMLFSPPESLG